MSAFLTANAQYAFPMILLLFMAAVGFVSIKDGLDHRAG
jgi:hypothetical protein